MLIQKGESLLNSQYCIRVDDLPLGDLAHLQNDLTYTITKDYDPKGGSRIFTTCTVDDGIIMLPRQYGLMHFGKPTHWGTVKNEEGPTVPFPLWTPRQGQEEAIVDVCNKLSVRYGGCLQMYAGGGKTVSSLQIAHRLQIPTSIRAVS